ncbi:MAG: arylsulfatase [Bryobacterales bacterium]|nr:arylsulfatase [Bryobacterales bacterium]
MPDATSFLSRRTFLQFGASAAALPWACSDRGGLGEARPPNIIVTMADDMGYSDIGCYGGEISTPVLDRLAANGLRFRSFYNYARCCPTRASLVTGLYPHQAGVGHMMSEYREDGAPIPSYMGNLNKSCVTIAEVLRSAGYSTLMSGKWHVTPAEGTGEEVDRSNWPLQRGFDKFYGTIHGAGSFYDPVSLRRGNEPEDPGSGFYYTTAIGENAARFIEETLDEKPESPFFLYLPFTAPHWPLHAPEDAIAKYKGRYDAGWDALREERLDRMRQVGAVDGSAQLSDRDPSQAPWDDAPDKEWQARRMEVYAAQVELMDEAIGRVVTTLEERGQLDNTLILFLADNGGCAEEAQDAWQGLHIARETYAGDPVAVGNDPSLMPGPEENYQSYGIPWANVSNTPFRYYKHWVHEGGISSPLIAHWPEGIEARGDWSDQLGHLIDVMPTCVDVSGASYPATFNDSPIHPMEGASLAPVFRGKAAEGHPEGLFWEHEGNRAVRVGDWKLVSKRSMPENGQWELYNIAQDRSELNDLANEMPERVGELAGLWQQWADRVGVVERGSWDRG